MAKKVSKKTIDRSVLVPATHGRVYKCKKCGEEAKVAGFVDFPEERPCLTCSAELEEGMPLVMMKGKKMSSEMRSLFKANPNITVRTNPYPEGTPSPFEGVEETPMTKE